MTNFFTHYPIYLPRPCLFDSSGNQVKLAYDGAVGFTAGWSAKLDDGSYWLAENNGSGVITVYEIRIMDKESEKWELVPDFDLDQGFSFSSILPAAVCAALGV